MMIKLCLESCEALALALEILSLDLSLFSFNVPVLFATSRKTLALFLKSLHRGRDLDVHGAAEQYYEGTIHRQPGAFFRQASSRVHQARF